MNKYRITTFNYGHSQAFIIEAFDIPQALQCGQFNAREVVKVEFIDSSNELDTTQN